MRRGWWCGVIPAAFSLATVSALVFQANVHAALSSRSGEKSPAQFSIRWIADPTDTNKLTVQISGLSAAQLQALRRSDWKPAQWQRLLSVFVGSDASDTRQHLPPMLGDYEVLAQGLRFAPRFPLEPGGKYRVVFHPGRLPDARSSNDDTITALFQAPTRPPRAAAFVSHVYPSADLLPENLLKFYIHFSAPMNRGHIYEHIHLRDEAGKDIELPFLEIDEELWDPAMMRLTLFIDPGRIKRGVKPLEEIGPALETGKRYTLEIERAWQDATGNPLKENFRKQFQVAPPDREPPDPARWQIHNPPNATREALVITFPEPMDQALALRVIRVAGPSGEPVVGQTTLDDSERRWAFIPANPWRNGPHNLVVQTTIEDLAGNNIGKPFEVDLFDGVERQLTHSTVKLPFEIR